MMTEKPLTIGYLAPTVSEGTGLLLWKGILEEARVNHIRLVTFSGSELHFPEPYFFRANQVYELASQNQLDGLLIWTSALAAFIGDTEMGQFCQNFAPLPMVGIGKSLTGIPAITLESYQGMRDAILHLVNHHGKRRVAFIRGPEHHIDAQERLRAYLDVVAEYHLDDNPDLISPNCRWLDRDAGKVMRILVEERKVVFDSVVAANDQLAYGVLTYLHEKGFRLPEDVAIVGFDNNPLGRVCTPPLTTVSNRMHERGRRALQLLLSLISGESAPALITLPTKLRVRQSCGCQDPYIVQAAQPPLMISAEQALPRRSQFIELLQAAVPSAENDPHWPELLIDAFEKSLEARSEAYFITTISGLIHRFLNEGLATREWQAALTELRNWCIVQHGQQADILEYGERLLHQGRIMVEEITTRDRAYQEWTHTCRLNDVHRLQIKISACDRLDNLLETLAEELPKLGIPRGCLATYQDTNRPLDGANLVLAFNPYGRLFDLENKIYSPSSNLAPPNFPEFAGMDNIIVHSLYFGKEIIGFLILDASAFEGSVNQMLREHISSTLKNVLLIEQNINLYEQARHNLQLAEEANLLKSRFLSIVSHELLTPIVLLVGLSEMMLREEIGNRPALPSPYRQDLTRIHASAQQLGGLVRDVLDLTRSHLGQLTLMKKPVSLADVIRPIALVCEQMTTSKGLKWELDIPDQIPPVLGDTSRLQQVVLNLVNNAVKFTSQGKVALSVKIDPEFITVSVSDTGLSVPEDEKDSIFDEFHQSKRTVARGFGGLGIGLAICRQLIEMHNGTIAVESSGIKNSGSTFYFKLPVLMEAASVDTDEQTQVVMILTEQGQHTLRLSSYLEQRGYRVQTLDIQQEPDWLQTVASAPPGAFVLDFQANERGMEILSILRQSPSSNDTPIIFYSLLIERDSGSVLALDCLPKPAAPDQLVRIIDRYGVFPLADAAAQKILIVDDDQDLQELHARIIKDHLPKCQVLCASNGREALEIMRADPPALILLDLMMPEVDGMAVLRAMQEERYLQGIPVIVLTAQRLNAKDIAILNNSAVTVLSKGVFTTAQTLVHIEKALAKHPRLGSENRRLVGKVMAYIHDHYDREIDRKELADFAGVSERHLNRCFSMETDMTPLAYLNRYRIQQAKLLLQRDDLSISEVVQRVGFLENSHFAHVFRREVGVSPSEYKRNSRK